MKKIKLLLLLLISFFIISSCDDYVDCSDYDFSDCTFEEPTTGFLQITLTIDSSNDSVPVDLFIGKVEDGIIDTSFIATEIKYVFELPINVYYSVRAEYNSLGTKVFAIDGEEMETYLSSECEQECWKIRGDDLYVRLKYEE